MARGEWPKASGGRRLVSATPHGSRLRGTVHWLRSWGHGWFCSQIDAKIVIEGQRPHEKETWHDSSFDESTPREFEGL